MQVRPVGNIMLGGGLLSPMPAGPGFARPGSSVQPIPLTGLFAAPAPAAAMPSPAATPAAQPAAAPNFPPSSYMAPNAASMPMSPTPITAAPIMPTSQNMGARQPAPAAPAAPAEPQQAAPSFFGSSFEDPRTRRNLAGAAALLEAGGPQLKPVGTGQAVGMAINAMLGQQSEMDKLKKVSAKGFEARGPVVRKGTNEYLGEGVFNPNTGAMMLSMPGGEIVPMPADAEPTVKSSLSRDIIAGNNMIKLESTIADHENSLSELTNYMKTQSDTDTGFKRLANKFSTAMKTFFNTGELSESEFAQARIGGQLQGLLGANRLAIVGGGVMTEQDALRVLEAVGGDITALQNPQVVEAAIRRIYGLRYNQYETDYNNLVRNQTAYGLPIRDKILNPFDTSGSLPSSQGNVGYTILPPT